MRERQKHFAWGSAFLFSFFLCFPAVRAEQNEGGLRGNVTINTTRAEKAVLYLLPTNGTSFSPAPMKKTIIQNEIQFAPNFNVVTVGSTIRFENHDKKIHNVHSKSPENRFDLRIHMPNTVKQITLKNSGVVSLRCNIHREMRGLIYVSPSPLFSVTDAQGNFAIRNVPPGVYRLVTWHSRLTPQEVDRSTRVVDVGKEIKSVHVRISSRADDKADLTDVVGQDWAPVVEEIHTRLEGVVTLWLKGSRTAASTRIMTTHSRLYLDSGLQNAIVQSLGEDRDLGHQLRIEKIRRWVQGVGKEPVTEAVMREEIRLLVDALREDARKIMEP